MLDHLSHSAIRTYCTDKRDFFKKYILKETTFDRNATAEIWSTIHKYLEARQKGKNKEEARQEALKYLESVKDEMTYTKSQTEESVIREVERVLDMPELDEILSIWGQPVATELSITEKLEWLGLPIKWVIDSIREENDEQTIIDYKVVSTFSDLCPAYEIQAMIYFWLYYASTWILAKSIKFVQIKKSKNTNWEPQYRVIEIEPTPERLQRVALFIKAIVHEIMHNELYHHNQYPIYTPNPFNREAKYEDWLEFGSSFTF